jgi:hypothetical protein
LRAVHPESRKSRKDANLAKQEITALERLKTLDAERERILSDAKREALDRANQALHALNDLGFSYRLVEGGGRGRPPAREKRQGTRARAAAAPGARPCPICGFATDPPHDGRAHRGQSQKAAFTGAELEARGLRRI